jgi:hypothetical protein
MEAHQRGAHDVQHPLAWHSLGDMITTAERHSRGATCSRSCTTATQLRTADDLWASLRDSDKPPAFSQDKQAHNNKEQGTAQKETGYYLKKREETRLHENRNTETG